MENYSKLENGWFSEICPMWPGMALAVEVRETLYSKKSPYQQIDLYQTRSYGKMLVLDGIIQLTERDEFAYHEMMAHLPLMAHPAPRKVLVVGGGDGGVLREVCRHGGVEEIDFCEIDEMVVDLSRAFLPNLSCGFDDARVRVHIRDGNGFVLENKGAYDVIIVDSSDPVGPGEALFERAFYRGLKQALKPGGIVATQGEAFFLHREWVEKLVGITRSLFPVHGFANILVPSYPGGHLGVCLGSLGPELTRPGRKMDAALQDQLRYYSPRVHSAAFVLPRFAEDYLNGAEEK